MLRIISLLLIACALGLSFVCTARAAGETTEDTQARQEKLENEIEAVKSQIMALQDKLFALQRELELLTIATASPAADADPIIAGASQTLPSIMQEERANDARQADEDKNAEKQEKPFRSGADILKRIPPELIPKPDEMTNEFKIGAINEWLAEEMLGKKMQVSCVVRNPRITSTYAQRRTAERQWTLNVELTENATSRFRTIQVATRYYRPHFNTIMRKHYPSAITFEGNSDFKNVADRVEDGHSAKIEGVIKVIEFKHSILTKPQWTLSIALEDLTVDIERLRKFKGNLVTE